MALSAGRPARLELRLRRLRDALERNRDGATVATSPKDRGRAELQLEEFRASDRVQSEGVHALRVRQDSRSSFWASAGRVASCPESSSRGSTSTRALG